MLEQAILRWRAQGNDEHTDTLTKAVLTAILFVAEHLVQNKALLLPQVCRVFLEAYGVLYTDSIKSVDLTLEVGENKVKFSSRWVLNQLIIHLNPYVQYKCIHMKFGIVIYEGYQLEEDHEPVHHRVHCENEHKAIVLSEAANILNDLIHDEIKKYSSLDAEYDQDPLWLSIDKYLQHVDPLLVNFIASSTRTLRERQQSRLSNESEVNSHVKKVRQYFILSLLLYCTNPKQPPPLHNLLADVV